MAGLYVHIPYCHAKCYYCDFFSTPRSIAVGEYVDAVVAEAMLRRDEIREPFKTLYIGGGTPSSLGVDLLARLVAGLRRNLNLDGVEEFTIEVNPEDVDETLVSALSDMGVNRVSMGVQSFNDDELKAVGRRHTAARAKQAATLLASRFDNINLDLIFGLPGQTMESLSRNIDTMVQFSPAHVSAYLLSYEEGTLLYSMLAMGKVTEASESMALDMYNMVRTRLGQAGYRHYEISNYARDGLVSRHNSAYWNWTPYLGLGVSAHSFDGNVRRYNEANIKQYISSIASGTAYCVTDIETLQNQFNDYLITSLRTDQGLNLASIARQPFGKLIADIGSEIEALSSQKLVVVNNGVITIPEQHWLTADAILRRLIL